MIYLLALLFKDWVVFCCLHFFCVIIYHAFTFNIVMHPQALEWTQMWVQTENNGRVGSQGTLLGSQHFEGVEGRAGAPRWD
jgi:hypothetical protein